MGEIKMKEIEIAIVEEVEIDLETKIHLQLCKKEIIFHNQQLIIGNKEIMTEKKEKVLCKKEVIFHNQQLIMGNKEIMIEKKEEKEVVVAEIDMKDMKDKNIMI